jgi:hypothetical protein
MTMSEQANPAAVSELDSLLRTRNTLSIGGKQVTVSPVKIRDISPFAQSMLPLVHAISPDAASIANIESFDFTGVNWLKIVMWHGADCIRAVSLATGEPEEWVGALELDEMVMLVAEVVAVNLDFFVTRLAPAMKAALGRIQPARMDGPTPGSSSSHTGTGAAT